MPGIETGIRLTDNMTSVLNNILAAVDNLINRMNGLEANMNFTPFGLEQSNADLQVMRASLDDAVQEQIGLNEAVADLSFESANSGYTGLTKNIRSADSALGSNVKTQKEFTKEVEKTTKKAQTLNDVIRKGVKGFLGFKTVQKTVNFVADSMEAYNVQSNAERQLMAVMANTLDESAVQSYAISMGVEVTPEIRSEVLQSSFDAVTAQAADIQSRGIFGDEVMIAAAGELATYFSDTDAITTMMDTLANYAVGMNGVGEVSSDAMVNYATNLGKIMTGSYDAMTKKGFEFSDAQKAIIEGTATQAQIAATLGEEYLGVSDDMLAALTISQVINEDWAGLYETMSDTPEGAIISMNNSLGDLRETIGAELYPYVMLFVDAVRDNWPVIEGIANGIANALKVVMGVLGNVFSLAMRIGTAIADNWSYISPVIYGVAAALGAYYSRQLLTLGIDALSTVRKLALGAATFFHTGALGAETAATEGATIAQTGLNLAMLACPLTWIVVGIAAIIAVLAALCSHFAKVREDTNSAFSVMVGGVYTVGAWFKNLGLTVANVFLGINNAVDAITYNIQVAFHNAILSVQGWFYGLMATAMEVIAGIAESLNKLPFVSFDFSGLTEKAEEYAGKAAEAAESKEEYKSVLDAFQEGMSTYETWGDNWASEAFSKGVSWGDSHGINGLFGVNELDNSWFPELGDVLEDSGLAGDVADIAGNTGAIADSLDVTETQLKYLRDLAEMEAVNRYTVAEIHIDQSGMQNTIQSGDDIDGFMTKLTDAVNESIFNLTEGVHV